jgi:hypothetical protein
MADPMSAEALAMVLTIGGLLAAAFVAGVRLRPSIVLLRVEKETAALRSDIDGYRAAQQHLAESLERRMDDLEQTTAQAAVEVRLASTAVMSQLEPGSTDDSRRRERACASR